MCHFLLNLFVLILIDNNAKSGGPILNNSFEVIGIAAAKLNDTATLSSSGSIPQNLQMRHGTSAEPIYDFYQYFQGCIDKYLNLR
jgi:hypothetical protein